MRLRLFVAVDVPPEVRAGIDGALADLRREQPWLRWTDPSQWHLTLVFLGWADEERVGAVTGAVAAAAGGRAPFELCLDGRLGSFGRRVLWAGIGSAPGLDALAEAVRAGLATAGVAFDERPFHAHLTVARAPRDRRIPAGLGEDTPVPERSWQVTEVLVMRSRLSRGGARHEVVSRAPLG